jgi:MFS superfamily sulfate permease-like transporter
VRRRRSVVVYCTTTLTSNFSWDLITPVIVAVLVACLLSNEQDVGFCNGQSKCTV